ncbi:MAG: cobalt ECF transporter T component CbiQ [Actinomycetota bacterium]|jgi:cobalt/nickel transport system permease protein|nr:MAG: cobalt ECF transporter T component CbiQ [Actinomycetota bacterium]
MSGAHAHALYYHEHSPVHRAPAACKLAAHLAFVLIVVATPREAVWAFGAYAVLLVLVGSLARLPLGFALPRLAVELPFVAFALILPFIASGERIEVGGLALSRDGLWGAWNILAKGTLGVGASVIVAATTTLPELVHGLERLRLPRVFTQMAAFMVRYLDVIADELRRMRLARTARAYDPRWLWQARAIAASAGALFIRSFERGERVWLAMVSRGYEGSMPAVGPGAIEARWWVASLAVPGAAGVVCVLAWIGLR